ncbi:MAG TPA: hypothetical protein VMJ52_14495 [Xanthobacteraceae bacterium]|nr:hypothetical protein [Xanthobacteraceae bacterium]
MARAATKRKPRLFHATVHVTRVEEWFVEAQDAEEAKALIESGEGHRVNGGACVHVEIDNLSE